MTTDAPAPARRTLMPTWVIAAIGVFFGLFYAFAVWQAVGNTIAVAGLLNALGWFVWLFAIAFPLIVFGAAFALSYRRRATVFALVLLTGLTVVGVFWLNLLAYTVTNTASLIA